MWKNEFTVDPERVFNMISISRNTYYKALNELMERGLIVFTRSENRALLGKIKIINLCQNLGHEVVTESVHDGDTQLNTSSDSRVTLDKPLDNKPLNSKKINKSVTFVPPTRDEVRIFFKEKGSGSDLADRAFDHYETGNWFDSTGKKVKNWKQKMLTNWISKEKEKSSAQKEKFFGAKFDVNYKNTLSGDELREYMSYWNYRGYYQNGRISMHNSQPIYEYYPDRDQTAKPNNPKKANTNRGTASVLEAFGKLVKPVP